MYTILIDAGHYGQTNKSPCKVTYYESEMSWKLHNYLKAELEKYGFIVKVTRADQKVDLPVYDRGKLAKGCDMFLSLHSNAVGSFVKEGCDRPVIIYPIKNSTEQKKIAEKFGKCIRETMCTGQNYQLMTRAYPDTTDIDYYGVIRGAVAVGCKNAFILEHGFHTDTKCTLWLLMENNLKILAQNEAKTIADYFNIGLPTKEKAPTKKEDDEEMTRYKKLNDVPEGYFRDKCKEYMNRGIIKGYGNGEIDITLDMLRELIMTERLLNEKK